ncbi:MAG: hypothetical protein JNN04_07445 [Cyclobacteriaceae bacterium]|nr:hypothetical protein [Cyclobacteriaceae bacterium]
MITGFHRIFLLLALSLLCVLHAQGQRSRTKPPPTRVGSTIVDDSTKMVYGPESTRWTTEKDLFKNRPNYRPLDTTLSEYHRWTYVQRFQNFYQDLGVVGTALNEIFPSAPDVIGATSGFKSYSPYYGTQEPVYFDTKSPFSRFHIIWGGKGRALTTVEFSRNISPRWNFGFNYRPILVDKQLQSFSNNDQMVISHYYDFYTTYNSKNSRYFLLFNFRRIRHQVAETGGVDTTAYPGDAIFDPNAKPVLSQSKTEEFRASFHIYQHYQLASPFQLYHIADFIEEENRFLSKDDTLIFDANMVLSDQAQDLATFKSMRQEAGFKGNLGKVYYSAYYKLRTYRYGNRYLDSLTLPVETTGNEQYLGLRAGFQLDSVTYVSGAAEYLFGGYYKIEAELKSPWLDASFRNTLSKPGFMQQVYRGSHDFWMQSFTGINTTQAKGMIKIGRRDIQLKAGAAFTLFDRQVVFREVSPGPDGQRVLPFQSTGNQIILSPEVSLSMPIIPHVYFRPQVIYTSIVRNDDNIIKLPLFFVNAQLVYEHIVFRSKLQMQLGADFHWRSTYQALAYDTPTQSFYVQEGTYARAYPVVDVFFVGKMSRFRFFVKYNNLIQAFTGKGYQITPGYTGQRSVLDLGFDFMLFD